MSRWLTLSTRTSSGALSPLAQFPSLALRGVPYNHVTGEGKTWAWRYDTRAQTEEHSHCIRVSVRVALQVHSEGNLLQLREH